MECHKCGKFFPISIVIDGKRRILNKRKFCLKCSPLGQHNTRDLNTSKQTREELCEYNRNYMRNRRLKLRATMVNYLKDKKCGHCSENHISCMEFHHEDPSKKEFTVGQIVGQATYTWNRILVEIQKCVLLCSNCHRKLHYNLKQLEQSPKKPRGRIVNPDVLAGASPVCSATL